MAKFPTSQDGKTLAAVIGDPVLHSLSPTIYNAAFEHDQIDWVYTAINLPSGEVASLVDEMRIFQIGGLSVTMPHKEIVANLVDEMTSHAQKLKVVNCVSRKGNSLIGHNTDGAGFLRALEEETKEGISGKTCLIIGAGGAARAVSLALGESGAKEVIISSRDVSKSETVASLAGKSGRVGSVDDGHRADLIVNATPVGMNGTKNEGLSPLPATIINKDQIVVDLIYHPIETELLASARKMGAQTMNGIGMLVHQAALQYTLWTGKEAPMDAMYSAVIKKIS